MGSNKACLLRHEQVKLLYEAIPFSVAATLVNALVLVAVDWEMVEHQTSLLWLAAITLVSLARLALALVYRKLQPAVELTARWETYFTICTVAIASLWGAVSLFLFPDASVEHQVFVAFIIGGICAGAVTSLSQLPLQIFSFFILALGPLIIRFFMLDSTLAHMMGAMLLLFLFMIAVSGLRIHRHLKQNISLRMQSEEQERVVLETQMEQQAILDHAPVGIWLVGMDGRYRFVNRTFCDAVGVAEKAFLASDDLGELLGEEAAINCRNSDRACIEQDEAHHSLESVTFADGKQHLLDITKVKIMDGSGKINGVVGIAADITERHQAEDKLRIMLQAIEQTGESIIITDREGLIEYANPAFTKITGYRVEEVLGKNPRILQSGNQTAEYYQRMWETIANGGVWNSAIIDRRKDGSQYPALMSIAPISDGNGDITHYVGIQQDMTTNEAVGEKFLQAQKMEAIGILVGGIAHEFNNMLAGMTGNLYLAKAEVAAFPGVVEHLDKVERLSFRAADMIKQLLTFARKGRVVLKPFNLTSFIKTAAQHIATGMPEAIHFHIDFCDQELRIRGDSAQFQQLLISLISNARDAVEGVAEPDIGMRVELFEADETFSRKHPECPARMFAHLVVSDNGSGIKVVDKEHIFEPFYSTKEVGQGTGLGLSTAYGMVQSHHGVLTVESTVGEGSAFHVYLPLLTEEKPVSRVEAGNGPVAGEGELILIVDDDVDIRSACSSVLKNTGYQVLEAADGLEAIEIFRTHQDTIAMIIMDIVMPGLTGVQTVERIRQIAADVKVIFATGYDQQETLKSGLLAGEYPVVFKPYSIVMLSRLIREQLDQP